MLQKTTRTRFANLVSIILNPFVAAIGALFALAGGTELGFWEIARWSLIVLGVSLGPVLVVSIILVRMGRLDNVFASVRRQRTGVYVLAAAFTTLDYAMLRLLHAPKVFIAGMGTGLMSVIVFGLINLWWKISVHTAFAAGFVTVLVAMYGWMGLLTAPLVVLIGWARVEAGEHSVSQVVVGALLSVGISLFGLGLWGMV